MLPHHFPLIPCLPLSSPSLLLSECVFWGKDTGFSIWGLQKGLQTTAGLPGLNGDENTNDGSYRFEPSYSPCKKGKEQMGSL